MAIRKAIFDVDLGGEALKRALADLQKFKTVAASIPAAVAAAGRSVVRAAGGIRGAGGVPAAAGGGGAVTPAEERQEQRRGRGQVRDSREVEQATHRTALYWQAISGSVRETGRNLRGYTGTLAAATGSLLKFTGVTVALKGLLLGGGIFGLERLASSAYAGRRSSSGLGIGYGGQQAFGLAYERLINSGGLLSGVSQARSNITSEAAGSLYSLGINPATATGNTGSVSNDVLMRVRQLVQQTPEHELGILAQNYRLGELGFGHEDLRRLKGTPDSEFEGYRTDFERRTKQLDIQDSVLRRWQDLDVQLDATAQKLKKGLLEGLELLAKPLGNLSEAFSDLFLKLAQNGTIQQGLAYLAKGLSNLGDYLGKDEFKNDLKLFVDSIAMLAQKTVAALRILGVIPGGDAGAAPGGLLQNDPKHWMYRTPSGGKYNGTVEGSPVIAPTRAEIRRDAARTLWNSIIAPFSGGTSPEMQHYMKAIKQIESGSEAGNYLATGPQVRYRDGTTDNAHGAYGVMGRNIPAWTRQYLGREMSIDEFRANPQAQDEVFRKRWEEMLRKYGNPQDAASEWHSGVDLQTARRQGRHDGNMATSEYVNRFNRNLGQQGVSININNNTGGNATVTVAPMGLGAPNY